MFARISTLCGFNFCAGFFFFFGVGFDQFPELAQWRDLSPFPGSMTRCFPSDPLSHCNNMSESWSTAEHCCLFTLVVVQFAGHVFYRENNVKEGGKESLRNVYPSLTLHATGNGRLIW